MIIPDNLRPLPVLPQSASDEREPTIEVEAEDFVSEEVIQELLSGPMAIDTPAGRAIPETGGFAGREDISSPFVSLAAKEDFSEAPSKPFRWESPHPALAEPRTTTPRPPTIEHHPEHSGNLLADRWWIFAMALTLVIIICSGALIEYSGDASAEALPSPATKEAGGPAESEEESLIATKPEVPLP